MLGRSPVHNSHAPVYKLLSQLLMALITPVLIIILLIALQLGYITEVPNCLLNLPGEQPCRMLNL